MDATLPSATERYGVVLTGRQASTGFLAMIPGPTTTRDQDIRAGQNGQPVGASPESPSSTDPSTGFPKVGDPERRTSCEVMCPATRLAAELNGRNDQMRSLTFGAYLISTWLPGKKINLAESTWDGYRRKIDRHILPAIGHVRIRRLRAHHLETLYDRMLYPTDDRRPLAPKTVLEVHLIIRGALNDAVRRGLVSRNVALVAHAPKLRSIPKTEPQAWNAQQLQAFLQAAAGHRLFPAFWVLAATGMRRSELLGLRWDDVDFKKARVSVNRGLVAVAYEVRESRGKTPNARRAIDLDPTTIKVLKAWKEWQRAEQEAAGIESESWVFTNNDGKPVHPHSISQTFERIANRAGVRASDFTTSGIPTARS